MKRVDRGHWRMGSSALVLLVVDGDGRDCCLGRVRSIVMRLRRFRRGWAVIGGEINCGGVV